MTVNNRSGENYDYELVVEGILDQRWSEWFPGMNISHRSDGNTVLRGEVVDQSALQGILQKICGLNMALISINKVEGQNTADMGNGELQEERSEQ